jgi:uncharacterized protein YjeT (DUF2065 family)
MILTGGSWWLAPTKFVLIYRKVAPADRAAKTAAWEEAVRSASGRFIGVFMVAFGCVILWILYSPFR